MFDHIITDPAQTTAWRDHISWGHIVLYRFPVWLPREDDRPKARPCLILKTPVLTTQPYAVIAYGTSAESRANRGYDVDVKGAEAAEPDSIVTADSFVPGG